MEAIKACHYLGHKAAQRLRITRSRFKWLIIKFGIRLRPKFNLHSAEELVRMAHDYRDCAQASRAMGTSSATLRNIFAKRGVPWPWTTSARRNLSHMSDSEVESLYISSGCSIRAASRSLGMADGTFRKEMKRRGIQKRSWGKLGQVDPEEIRRLYIDEGIGTVRIGKALGVSSRAICGYLKRHGIPTRDRDFMWGKQRDIHLRQQRDALGHFISEPLSIPPSVDVEDARAGTEPSWLNGGGE